MNTDTVTRVKDALGKKRAHWAVTVEGDRVLVEIPASAFLRETVNALLRAGFPVHTVSAASFSGPVVVREA